MVTKTDKPGTVYLVGAGPGDPGLITLKGLQYLESADVVVHDRLVDERLLARASKDAELIDVGKVPGEQGNPQANTNAMLVSKARDGKRVVRLKGGDPFVFGRGGEEADALKDAEIPFEIVPGVTSAVAAPAYAGIPLTHRNYASSVTVITGSEALDTEGVAWDKLAQTGGTLVVLMGWENMAGIADKLVDAGRPESTPAALIEWGSEPYQRTVVGTLSDVVGKATEAGLKRPIVAVVGEVVELRKKLQWFDNRPLFGKRVLVTRSRNQASVLSEMLSREGAWPLEVPTIEIQSLEEYAELDAALSKLPDYDWVVFLSTNAVEAVFERLEAAGRDARAFYSARVAAIGSATATALLTRGISADFVPAEFVSESMADSLNERIVSGARVLLPRADIGRETLRDGLAAHGARVDDIIAYRTVTPEKAASRLSEVLSEGVDIATFTSTSTVRNLAGLLEGDLGRLGDAKIACIGPITADAVSNAGLNVDILAEEYTVAGLVDALSAYFAKEVPSIA